VRLAGAFPGGFIVFLLLGLSACGYHTAGHAVNLPNTVHTIAVPTFTNKSEAYRVEQILTASVVREFNTRTQYHVISEPDSHADATLHGTVLQVLTAPLTYDSQTGRASSALVAVSVQVSLVDRKGKILYQDPNYTFRSEYQISGQPSAFFDQESPALDRLSGDFARTLVSNILEAY
jgi:outer membrane lipopolysaccharide assembly protein LptE/RlpB